MDKSHSQEKDVLRLGIGAILIRFGGTFIGTLALQWLLVEICELFIEDMPLENSGWLSVVSMVFVAFVVSSVCTFWCMHRRLKATSDAFERLASQPGFADRRFAMTLVADIESAHEEKNWNEVIKIGSVLSRPLWVTGKYELRYRIGTLVEEAAGFAGQHRTQAAALIDDLGWTVFVLGQHAQARENIKHGIQIAIACKDHFLAYKGSRHLSGIAEETGDLVEAEKQHRISEEYAKKIVDKEKKQEAIAGLAANWGFYLMKQSSWMEALRELTRAQKMYQRMHDKDREIKLFHYIGQTLYSMKRLGQAKDVFRKGLTEATVHARKDGILEDCIGLALIADRESDFRRARDYYDKAAKAARELGKKGLANELEAKALNVLKKS